MSDFEGISGEERHRRLMSAGSKLNKAIRRMVKEGRAVDYAMIYKGIAMEHGVTDVHVVIFDDKAWTQYVKPFLDVKLLNKKPEDH